MRITDQLSRSERLVPAARPVARGHVHDVHGLPARLLELQRTVGNTSVRRLIQCKLAVSQPGDPFEQEADRVADAVVKETPRAGGAGSVDRAPAPGGVIDEDKDPAAMMRLQRAIAPEEEDTDMVAAVARTASGDVTEVDGDTERDIRRLPGNGAPMAAAPRADMESSLGVDLGNVRVHTGSGAAQMARSVNAVAFTLGSDIVFDHGQYQPDTPSGKRLLAHELTHVVQQTGGVAQKTERRRGEA